MDRIDRPAFKLNEPEVVRLYELTKGRPERWAKEISRLTWEIAEIGFEDRVERIAAIANVDTSMPWAQILSEAIDWVKSLDSWPSSGDAARLIGVSPGRITQMCNEGKLRTNGSTGKARRIDPGSLLAHLPGESPITEAVRGLLRSIGDD